jgi:hypothetical protein
MLPIDISPHALFLLIVRNKKNCVKFNRKFFSETLVQGNYLGKCPYTLPVWWDALIEIELVRTRTAYLWCIWWSDYRQRNITVLLPLSVLWAIYTCKLQLISTLYGFLSIIFYSSSLKPSFFSIGLFSFSPNLIYVPHIFTFLKPPILNLPKSGLVWILLLELCLKLYTMSFQFLNLHLQAIILDVFSKCVAHCFESVTPSCISVCSHLKLTDNPFTGSSCTETSRCAKSLTHDV